MDRIASLDRAKGLFIILMTCSHISLAEFEWVRTVNLSWWFLFKMPGFYIISGFLMYNSIKRESFVKRKFDGMYKPFFFIVLILVLGGLILGAAEDMSWHNIIRVLLGYEGILKGIEVVTGPAWFVINLPFSFLICRLLYSSFIKKRTLVFILIVAALLLFAYKPDVLGFSLPFRLDVSFYAVLYLFTGFFLRHFQLKLENKHHILTFGLLFFILKLSFFDTVFLNLFENSYGNFALTYVASTSAVLAIIACCALIKDGSLLSKALTSCSKQSLYILILHIPLYHCLRDSFHFVRNLFGNTAMIVFTHFAILAICVMIAVLFKKIDRHGYFFQARVRQ